MLSHAALFSLLRSSLAFSPGFAEIFPRLCRTDHVILPIFLRIVIWITLFSGVMPFN